MASFVSTFKSLTSRQKALLVFAIPLVLSSYAGMALFAFLSALSPFTKHFSQYGKVCFFLCSGALVGWMVLCTVGWILEGGLMVIRGNVVLYWLLAIAALMSAFIAFHTPANYAIVSALILLVGLFNYRLPIFVEGLRLLWPKYGKALVPRPPQG